MNEQTPPSRIVLATDMSARCDRALDRAAQLAHAWRSTLAVIHTVPAAEVAERDRLSAAAPSWRRPESWSATLERQLRADLAAQGIAASPEVVVGAPAETLLAAAGNEGTALIVLGIAKDARRDRLQLGSTVDSLVRQSPVPVLNVRSRPRAPYRHVVVATDFSPSSRQALRLAACWFGDARLTLFHAYMPPGATLTSPSAANDAWRTAMTQECDAHLAAAGLSTDTAVQCLIEEGRPEALLADYVSHSDADLVALGAPGRSGIARTLLGSTAENLLHALDCDTLVVRGA